ncbi:restriction endonuclease subunit S [Gemmatimonadales bacterium]|nr:restriction endonuclease subunit S [Gemmatimonadales bacterium]
MRVATVGEISTQLRGVTYKKADASAVRLEHYAPVLRAGNIAEHGLTFDDLVYVPEDKIRPSQRVEPNDVVIAASSGSLSVVGKAAQAREGFDGGFGAFCKVLRPGPEVDPHYFGHFFRTPEYRHIVSQLAAGANINNLKNEHLGRLEIPLPPLAEQKRIAGILDAADELRTKRRESIEQLDTLLQSVFLDMFGDPVTNPKEWDELGLADVAEFHAGSTLPEGEAFHEQSGGFLGLKVSDLNDPANTPRVVRSKLWSADRGRGIVAPPGFCRDTEEGRRDWNEQEAPADTPCRVGPQPHGDLCISPSASHLSLPVVLHLRSLEHHERKHGSAAEQEGFGATENPGAVARPTASIRPRGGVGRGAEVADVSPPD